MGCKVHKAGYRHRKNKCPPARNRIIWTVPKQYVPKSPNPPDLESPATLAKTVSSKKPKPACFTLTEKIRSLAVTRALVPASYHT